MQKSPYQHDVVEYGQASPQGRVDFSQLLGLLQLLALFAQNKYTHQFANKCSTNIVSYLMSYCNKY